MSTAAIETGVTGHQLVLERFSLWLDRGRLASSYLFVGIPGIGKRRLALHLAKCLLCESSEPNELAACGNCPACQQVDAATHPDLLTVSRPPEKNLIPLDLLIGDREHRMRAGLCHDIALKPFRGGRRVAIIDDADFLNQEGANCLLKTLEEPPPNRLIILIASSEHRQLPTIRSRCQTIRFRPLAPDQIEQILVREDCLEDASRAGILAAASGGSVQMALRLADDETWAFRNALYKQLATLDPGQNDFAEVVASFVNAVGNDAADKDAAAKRDRLRLISDLSTQFYRQVMIKLSDSDSADENSASDSDMLNHVARSVDGWQGNADTAVDAVERCLEITRQVAASANQATLIECWLSDLGRVLRCELFID